MNCNIVSYISKKIKIAIPFSLIFFVIYKQYKDYVDIKS